MKSPEGSPGLSLSLDLIHDVHNANAYLQVAPFLYNCMLLFVQDNDEASLLELVKSQICDNVGLYAQKYDEEFEVMMIA